MEKRLQRIAMRIPQRVWDYLPACVQKRLWAVICYGAWHLLPQRVLQVRLWWKYRNDPRFAEFVRLQRGGA